MEKNGYKIPVFDIKAFATTIDNVLVNELNALALTSRSFVEENFAWNKVAERYIKYITEVVENYNANR